ncbi:MAG: hypothetical protein ACFFC1_10925 [Promethearchaeota archaeon]
MNKTLNKKKLIIPVINLILMILFIIGSFLINLPVLYLISVYALTLTTITVQYNHWFLNSLATPLTFTYTFAFIQDIIDLNPLFAFFHIPTVICCYIIIWRKNNSLILMLIISVLYAFWIYAIKTWLYFPYYDCIFFICDKTQQFFSVLIIGVITSIIASKPLKPLILKIFKSLFKDKEEEITEERLVIE